jgi:hypothetical protein
MKGWHKESYRHYLAAKGVKTNKYMARIVEYPGALPITPVTSLMRAAKWEEKEWKGPTQEQHEEFEKIRAQDLAEEAELGKDVVRREAVIGGKKVDIIEKKPQLTAAEIKMADESDALAAEIKSLQKQMGAAGMDEQAYYDKQIEEKLNKLERLEQKRLSARAAESSEEMSSIFEDLRARKEIATQKMNRYEDYLRQVEEATQTDLKNIEKERNSKVESINKSGLSEVEKKRRVAGIEQEYELKRRNAIDWRKNETVKYENLLQDENAALSQIKSDKETIDKLLGGEITIGRRKMQLMAEEMGMREFAEAKSKEFMKKFAEGGKERTRALRESSQISGAIAQAEAMAEKLGPAARINQGGPSLARIREARGSIEKINKTYIDSVSKMKEDMKKDLERTFSSAKAAEDYTKFIKKKYAERAADLEKRYRSKVGFEQRLIARALGESAPRIEVADLKIGSDRAIRMPVLATQRVPAPSDLHMGVEAKTSTYAMSPMVLEETRGVRWDPTAWQKAKYAASDFASKTKSAAVKYGESAKEAASKYGGAAKEAWRKFGARWR